MEDYIILIDENNQPYIAHAGMIGNAVSAVRSGVGRGVRQNHKYLMKIGEGPRARYLYTQEEVRAYMQGGRKALNNMAKNTKSTARKAVNKARDASDYVKENSALLNVGNQYRAAKRAHENSKSSDPEVAKYGKKGYEENNTLGGKAYKAQQKAKDKVGITAKRNADKAWEDVPKRINGNNKEDMKKFEKANKAQDEYRKTPLGKAEYYSERAKEIATGVDGRPKDAAKKLADKAKSTSDRMKDEFRKKKDEAKKVVEDASGVTAKKELEKAKRANDEAAALYRRVDRASKEHEISGDSKLNALRNLNEKEYNEFDKQYKYELTPLGKAEKTINKIKGKEEEKRGYGEGHNAELARKANDDYDREELEIEARRGPIDTKHVSKEYIYSLAGNSGYSKDVKNTMEKEQEYWRAEVTYENLKKNANTPADKLAAARSAMQSAEREYNNSLNELANKLNDDVESAKKELAKKKK